MRSCTLIFALILLASFAIAGCLFNKVSCKILSITIGDNGGFPSVFIELNTSDSIKVKLFKGKALIDEKEIYIGGERTLSLCLASYHEIPEKGTYHVKIYDMNDNLICDSKINIENPKLVINDLDIDWWKEEKDYVLLETSLNVTNEGNVPIYVRTLRISIDGTRSKVAHVYNETINPSSTSTISACTCIKGILDGSHSILVDLFDLNGKKIATFSSFDSTHLDFSIKKTHLKWYFEEKEYSITLPVPKKLLSYCSSLKRAQTEDYSFYAIFPVDDNYISFLSEKLLSLHDTRDIEEKINFVASFVQSIPYHKEEEEYPRFPIETIADLEGDCEDKAILASSILAEIGLDVALIRLHEHMAVGIHLDGVDYQGKVYYEDETGKRYLFLETSNVGWKLGDACEEFKDQKNYTIYHVGSKPLLLQECEPPIRYKYLKSDFVVVEDRILNFGVDNANNVELVVDFLAQYDLSVKKYVSEKFGVRAGGGRLIRLKINSPKQSFLKVKIDLIHEGKVVQSSIFIFE